MNGPLEGDGLPPFRQKKGERTGHGAFVADPGRGIPAVIGQGPRSLSEIAERGFLVWLCGLGILVDAHIVKRRAASR